MFARNIPSTSDENAMHESFKADWEKGTGKKFDKCSVLGCDEKAEHGGHVEISSDKKNWEKTCIVPLCRKHNNYSNTDVMELKDEAKCVYTENSKNITISENIIETIQEQSKFF